MFPVPLFPLIPNLQFELYEFYFDILNILFLDGDAPRRPSYGVYIPQLIRFARAYSHVNDLQSSSMYHDISENSKANNLPGNQAMIQPYLVFIKEGQCRILEEYIF